MLSLLSRTLVVVGAVSFLGFGLYAFILPDAAAVAFPWRVGPFLARTIGGWSIGTAAIAFDVAYHWRSPARTFPALVYLWVFAIAQAVVAAAFAANVRTASLLTVPYLVALGAFAGSAVVGAAWLLVDRPHVRGDGQGFAGTPRVSALIFAGLVLVLAGGNILSREGGAVTRGEFFPEAMTIFSVRAFAGFFLAIGIGAIALLVPATVTAWRDFARVGEYLIVPVTLAALLELGRFDLTHMPGHTLYLAAYLVVGALAAWAWGRYWAPRGEPDRRPAPALERGGP